MALNPFFTDLAANAMCNALAALANGGKLKIYDGTQPADANTAITTQNLLATLTLNATAFGAAAGSGTAPNRVSVATANAVTSDPSAIGTGTATWFRQYESDGSTALWDGSVGTSGADLNLSATGIVTTATVAVQSFTLTVPQ